MGAILTAVIAVTAIGILCAVMLVIADTFFGVRENEKIIEIRDVLPGANCGACGYTGCDGYAKALAEDESVPSNLCIPGGDSCAKCISEILGTEPCDVIEKVAVVRCNGSCENAPSAANYEGSKTCKSAKLSFGGPKSCSFGCIGYGDCTAVCQYDAIRLIDGVAKVDPKRCTGCTLCAKACPNSIISIVNADKTVHVKCSNKEKGAVARKECRVACIACMKCAKLCPTEAIVIENNLARIDYEKCIICGKCAEVCPTGAIVDRRPEK